VSKEIYQELLARFHALYAQDGSWLLDLRWHSVSGCAVRFRPLPDGGYSDVEWLGAGSEDPPFQAH